MNTPKELLDELTRVYVTRRTGYVAMDTVDRMLAGLPGMLADLSRLAAIEAARGGLTDEELNQALGHVDAAGYQMLRRLDDALKAANEELERVRADAADWERKARWLAKDAVEGRLGGPHRGKFIYRWAVFPTREAAEASALRCATNGDHSQIHEARDGR